MTNPDFIHAKISVGEVNTLREEIEQLRESGTELRAIKCALGIEDDNGSPVSDVKILLTQNERLRALVRTMEWQPIETAPTNISILIYIPGWYHYGGSIWRAIRIDMGTGKRWHVTALGMGRDLDPSQYPTQWKPLPESPEAVRQTLDREPPISRDAEIERLRGIVRAADDSDHVNFYEREFYPLSNFSAFQLEWKGYIFATSEAAYHWEKFPDNPECQRCVLHARSAHDAFKFAEDNKVHKRTDWDAVKVNIMLSILRAKADQHEYVRRKLNETGDRDLIECSWRDDFWGWGPNRDGQNMLGKLWMIVRRELRYGSVNEVREAARQTLDREPAGEADAKS